MYILRSCHKLPSAGEFFPVPTVAKPCSVPVTEVTQQLNPPNGNLNVPWYASTRGPSRNLWRVGKRMHTAWTQHSHRKPKSTSGQLRRFWTMGRQQPDSSQPRQKRGWLAGDTTQHNTGVTGTQCSTAYWLKDNREQQCSFAGLLGDNAALAAVSTAMPAPPLRRHKLTGLCDCLGYLGG